MKNIYKKLLQFSFNLVIISGFFLFAGHVFASSQTPFVYPDISTVYSQFYFTDPQYITAADNFSATSSASLGNIFFKLNDIASWIPSYAQNNKIVFKVRAKGKVKFFYNNTSQFGTCPTTGYASLATVTGSTIDQTTATHDFGTSYNTFTYSPLTNFNTGAVYFDAQVLKDGGCFLLEDENNSSSQRAAVDWVQASIQYGDGITDSLAGNIYTDEVCQDGDWICPVRVWLAKVFNFFFGFNQTFVSTQITAMQTSLNSHAPFAYINAVFSLDLSNTATSSAVPTYTLAMPSTVSTPDGHGGIRATAMQSAVYTDSGDIGGFLTLIRPYETIFVWILLIAWLAYEIPKRVF